MINIDENYSKFITYLETYIHRDGIKNLITWLNKSDAKTAPASTKYHLSCEGGLIQHSLNVFLRLITLLKAEYPSVIKGHKGDGTPIIEDTCPYSKETIVLVALLHDISKVGYYKKYYKNVQNDETGRWEKSLSYVVKEEENRLLYATHEENSVYMLSKFLKLTYEEELAIRYHMGSIDAEDSFAQSRMISVYKRSPLALFLHIADMQAMCIDEVNNNKVVEESPSVSENDSLSTKDNNDSSVVSSDTDNAPSMSNTLSSQEKSVNSGISPQHNQSNSSSINGTDSDHAFANKEDKIDERDFETADNADFEDGCPF